jgi:hypothetical protein
VGATVPEHNALCKTARLRRLGSELRIGGFFASEKVTTKKIVED